MFPRYLKIASEMSGITPLTDRQMNKQRQTKTVITLRFLKHTLCTISLKVLITATENRPLFFFLLVIKDASCSEHHNMVICLHYETWLRNSRK